MISAQKLLPKIFVSLTILFHLSSGFVSLKKSEKKVKIKIKLLSLEKPTARCFFSFFIQYSHFLLVLDKSKNNYKNL